MQIVRQDVLSVNVWSGNGAIVNFGSSRAHSVAIKMFTQLEKNDDF